MISNNMMTKDDIHQITQASSLVMAAEMTHLCAALKELSADLKSNKEAMNSLDKRMAILETTIKLKSE